METKIFNGKNYQRINQRILNNKFKQFNDSKIWKGNKIKLYLGNMKNIEKKRMLEK